MDDVQAQVLAAEHSPATVTMKCTLHTTAYNYLHTADHLSEAPMDEVQAQVAAAAEHSPPQAR